MEWPFLEQLLSANTLPYLDYAVSRRLLKDISFADEAMACFLCHLSLASRNGHLCICIDQNVVLPAPQELWLGEEAQLSDSMLQQISRLIIEGSQRLPISLCPAICSHNQRYYFQKYWTHETQFIEHVNTLKAAKPALSCDLQAVSLRLDQLIMAKMLLPEQAAAIKAACENCLTLISGGPGTGKTYTAAYLIKIFWETLSASQRQACEIALAAPTGKAAANLQKSLGKLLSSIPNLKPVTAKTLHALLGFKGQSPSLSADLIIIDESSMVDAKMIVRLFSAIKPGARLILLGDQNQLPPVESGAMFADMIRALEKPVMLSQCLRTDLQEIVDFAQAVNAGSYAQALTLLNQASGQGVNRFPQTLHLKQDLKYIVEYAASFYEYPEGKEDERLFAEFNHFRLLSPLRKGPFGVDELNARIMQHIAKQFRGRSRMAIPIMILNNDPRLEVFNGEVGVLIKQCPETDFCRKGDFAIFPSPMDSSFRKIPAILLPKYEYAYCMSVHKSQGSEFDQVLLLLPEGAEHFGREVLYTAITRARKHIEIYTQDNILQQTIEKKNMRMSGFI